MLFQGWAGSVLLRIFHSLAVPTASIWFEQNSVTGIEYFLLLCRNCRKMVPSCNLALLICPSLKCQRRHRKSTETQCLYQNRVTCSVFIITPTCLSAIFLPPHTVKLRGVVLPLVCSETWYIGHLCMLALLQMVTVWMTLVYKVWCNWRCLCKGRAG